VAWYIKYGPIEKKQTLVATTRKDGKDSVAEVTIHHFTNGK